MNVTAVMEEEERPGVLNTEYKLRDIIQFIGFVITAVVFIVTMNAKIEALTNAVNDLKDNNNKQSVANDLAIKALQNQVSTQTIQISLLQKDVDNLKAKK